MRMEVGVSMYLISDHLIDDISNQTVVKSTDLAICDYVRASRIDHLVGSQRFPIRIKIAL